MDEAGIDKGVVMTIVDAPEVNPDALELIAEACAAFPERLFAFARIHPWYGDEAVALLERAFALGFKGLKLHPVSTIAHPGGEDTLRLIRAAAAYMGLYGNDLEEAYYPSTSWDAAGDPLDAGARHACLADAPPATGHRRGAVT